MKSKLLIITTFYNENERLKFTLENMLRQKSTDFIHLIIDDGSTDNSSDEIVWDYVNRSKHQVYFEKHVNAGINKVHMHAFMRTEEFGCSHFMWLDCGDGLQEKAVARINNIINKCPDTWLHLDGYYVSDKGNKKIRMSSKSYLPYLRKKDQFLPFCLSISTYGHFIIPFKIYYQFNPTFELVDGFYYDAQIIGALSLNNCPHYFVQTPLSIIEDDQHFSVANSSANSYRHNLLCLSKFVVPDSDKRERISSISLGINIISIRQLFSSKNYFTNKSRVIALKEFYKSNEIKTRDRYKWFVLSVISLLYGG